VDADLRTLERAALAGGARERLAWARALERAGRGGDALAVLIPVHGDDAVRAHLETLPAWPTTEGPPGGTRFLEARPVTRAPRERWRTTMSLWPRGALVASPLALVTREHGALLVLDPRTGAVRHATTDHWLDFIEGLGIRSLVMRTEANRELSVDVLTGTSRIVGRRRTWSLRDAGIVIRSSGENVEAFVPAGGGERERCVWRRKDLGAVSGRSLGPASVGVAGDGTFAVFDRKTGDTVASGVGDQILVDGYGFVVKCATGVVAYDAAGRFMWGCPLPKEPFVRAVAPGFVIAEEKERTVVLDRPSGRVLDVMDEPTRALGVVRDVIYVARPSERGESRLAVRRPDGRELWSIETSGWVDCFAALDAVIYVGVPSIDGRTRDVVCLEEAPTKRGG